MRALSLFHSRWFASGNENCNLPARRQLIIPTGKIRFADLDHSRDIAAINQRFRLQDFTSEAAAAIPLISPSPVVPILYGIKLMRYTETHSTSGLAVPADRDTLCSSG